MTTSQEIVKHFGKKGVITIKKELGLKNCFEINKHTILNEQLSEMTLSWYVDYGRKKFPYKVEHLISWVKNKENFLKSK